MTLSVGFLKCDPGWADEPGKAREFFVDTGLDIGTFFHAAATTHSNAHKGKVPRLPVDAYQAEEDVGNGVDFRATFVRAGR